MEDVKQILVVDDYFQMLEFLRSVLEFSHHEYQVLAVPSAEEGILELQRTKFDLVITDVRLPGMSGFDLVRKVKGIRPNLPIVMITGYSSEQGEKEAAELGVKRYFMKPLNPDDLLATVHSILYGTEELEAKEQPEPEPGVDDNSADIQRRLEALRADTGAEHVVLSTVKGSVLYDSGLGEVLDLADLVAGIGESMTTTFLLAKKLKSSKPFTIQYQAGQKFDLYLANIGLDYFLAIFFDVKVRRGRLGTIWVFAQRAIYDLQGLLMDHQRPAASAPVLEDEGKAEPVKGSEEVTDEVEEESFIEESEEMEPLTLAEIQEMLGIDETVEAETVDLDSFWESALEASDDGAGISGMSLDEARKQGLIPSDFDDEERPKASN